MAPNAGPCTSHPPSSEELVISIDVSKQARKVVALHGPRAAAEIFARAYRIERAALVRAIAFASQRKDHPKEEIDAAREILEGMFGAPAPFPLPAEASTQDPVEAAIDGAWLETTNARLDDVEGRLKTHGAFHTTLERQLNARIEALESKLEALRKHVGPADSSFRGHSVCTILSPLPNVLDKVRDRLSGLETWRAGLEKSPALVHSPAAILAMQAPAVAPGALALEPLAALDRIGDVELAPSDRRTASAGRG